MRLALAILLVASPVVAQIPGPISDAELSRRLTTVAEELYGAEKRAARAWREAGRAAAPGTEAGAAVDALMYEDVLSLLDAAVNANPKNLHAHTIAADVLLTKAHQGDGTYDVCALLDARDQAELVTSASHTPAGDLAAARRVLRDIDRIPRSAIPDPPSTCDEETDESRGTTTIATKSH